MIPPLASHMFESRYTIPLLVLVMLELAGTLCTYRGDGLEIPHQPQKSIILQNQRVSWGYCLMLCLLQISDISMVRNLASMFRIGY